MSNIKKPSKRWLVTVFYNPTDDQYIIAVGTWIDENSEAIDLIIEEFDLPRENTIVQKASHWDIGQTWND